MNTLFKSFSVLAAAALLTACGGAGSGLPGAELENTEALPDLYFHYLSVPSEVDHADGAYAVNFTIKNIGEAAVVPYLGVRIAFYASKDDNITLDDKLMGVYQTPTHANGGDIAPGEIITGSAALTLPEGFSNGDYYFGAIIDPYYYASNYLPPDYVSLVGIEESDKNNNFSNVKPFKVTGGDTCTPDIYENDNSPEASTVIALGNVQSRNFCMDGADWLRFDAVAGNVYRFTREYDTLYSYPRLTIFAENGYTVLAKAPTYDAALDWSPPASGTYLVKVHVSNYQSFYVSEGNGVGTEYTLSLQ